MKRTQSDRKKALVDKSRNQSQAQSFSSPANYQAAYDTYAYEKYERVLRCQRHFTVLDMLRHYGVLLLWLMVLTVLFVAQRSLWQTHAANPIAGAGSELVSSVSTRQGITTGGL